MHEFLNAAPKQANIEGTMPIKHAALSILLVLGCRPRDRASLHEAAATDFWNKAPPGFAEQILTDVIADSSVYVRDVFNHRHPAMVTLRQVISDPQNHANRWRAVVQYAQIMKEGAFPRHEEVTTALMHATFKRDLPALTSSDKKLFCNEYFQCSYFLLALSQLTDIAPKAVSEIVQQFLPDATPDNFGSSYVRGAMVRHAASLIDLTARFKQHSEWHRLDKLYTAPVINDPTVLTALKTELNKILTNLAQIERILAVGDFNDENLSPELQKYLRSFNAPKMVKNIVFEILVKTQQAKQDLPDVTGPEWEALLAIAQHLFSTFNAIKIEALALTQYLDRTKQVDTAGWFKGLRADLQQAGDKHGQRLLLKFMLQRFAEKEFALATGNQYFYELASLFKIDQEEAAPEDAEAGTRLRDMWQKSRLLLTKTIEKLELAPLSESHDPKILAAQTQYSAQGQVAPLFGRFFHSLRHHLGEMLEHAAEYAQAIRDMSNKLDNHQTLDDHELQRIRGLAQRYFSLALWLRCLPFDGRVDARDATKHFFKPHAAEAGVFLGLKPQIALDEICFYDRDKNQSYIRRKKKDLSGLMPRIYDYLTDYSSFTMSRDMIGNAVMAASLAITAIPVMLEAGTFSHSIMGTTEELIRKGALRAGAERTLSAELAHLPRRAALVSRRFVEHFFTQTAVGRTTGALSLQMARCYTGAWGFNEVMKTYSSLATYVTGQKPTLEFNDFWVNPISMDVLKSAAVFFVLPYSNYFLVERLGRGSLAHNLVKRGWIGEGALPQFGQNLGLVHDTAFFTSMPYFEDKVRQLFIQHGADHPEHDSLSFLANVGQSYLAALAFRQEAFYGQFVNESPRLIDRAELDKIVEGTP